MQKFFYLFQEGHHVGLGEHPHHPGLALDVLDVVDCEADDEVHEDDRHVEHEDDEEQLGRPPGVAVRVAVVVLPEEHGQDLDEGAPHVRKGLDKRIWKGF